MVGDGQRARHVLLDQPDRDSALAGGIADGLEKATDHQRREPQREFVDEHDLGVAGQTSRQGARRKYGSLVGVPCGLCQTDNKRSGSAQTARWPVRPDDGSASWSIALPVPKSPVNTRPNSKSSLRPLVGLQILSPLFGCPFDLFDRAGELIRGQTEVLCDGLEAAGSGIQSGAMFQVCEFAGQLGRLLPAQAQGSGE
jgi:hypothetical protein